MSKTFHMATIPEGNEFAPAADAEPKEGRTQYGAICWRRLGDKIEVLLITSRDTGRWIIPKGWPISGLTPDASAAREAFEEAGVEGRVSATCIGLYSYDKGVSPAMGPSVTVPCVVAVFPLQVKGLRDRFPESLERRRKWFTPKKAARKVAEPELQSILESFASYAAEGKAAAKANSKPAEDAKLPRSAKAGASRKSAKA